MSINMGYHIKLNNEYEFHQHCAQKSIEAFTHTLNNQYYPSRFKLLVLLVQEVGGDPFYLARKLVEIVLNIFRMMGVQLESKTLGSWQILSDIAGMAIIQASIPILCTIMRISAIISGFLYPRWAVEGWKLAENAERLSYALWVQTFQEFNHFLSPSRQVCAEIIPSNAIFYLGESLTHHCLNLEQSDDNQRDLDVRIANEFSHLLEEIALNDENYFFDLIDSERINNPRIERGRYDLYPLTSNIRKILSRLSKYLEEERTTDELFDRFWDELVPEERDQLFNYVHLNLRRSFLEEKYKLRLNQEGIKTRLTVLKDLFSQRFRFGRAHFVCSACDFQF